MNSIKQVNYFKKITCLIIMLSVMSACNFNKKDKFIEKNSTEVHHVNSDKEIIADSIVHFLITSAANDFHTHQPPKPTAFRSLKIGYILLSSNEKQYVLCGEFLSEKQNWEAFATIKTSGYEHYIGNQALSFCENVTLVLKDETSLTTMLKNKLNELRHTEN